MERTLYFSRSSAWDVSFCSWELCCVLDFEHTLGERSAHDHAAHAGGGIEVLLARLAARAVEVGVDLGHRAGIVDVGGWIVDIVVVAGSSREVRAQSSKLLVNLPGAWVWTAVSPTLVNLGEGAENSGARRRSRVTESLSEQVVKSLRVVSQADVSVRQATLIYIDV